MLRTNFYNSTLLLNWPLVGVSSKTSIHHGSAFSIGLYSSFRWFKSTKKVYYKNNNNTSRKLQSTEKPCNNYVSEKPVLKKISLSTKILCQLGLKVWRGKTFKDEFQKYFSIFQLSRGEMWLEWSVTKVDCDNLGWRNSRCKFSNFRHWSFPCSAETDV